ncbi:uncharacterized protein STEHIDRAFT_154256 [Stereum hirsutum FP-91666 SS1]|uniref:uncharacterized protein n=1 Tax=Stereum hirsutum (strain FP-91666) TaxID=721885 RepID=UPI000440E67E|nr:uncharacterized protein STEHIDRAFT_154256 [Stereum hirsutum FP-91666 SS1]EIM90430.1 hypothetical protein STEHIDRAFT_154256 [Stereum hirsutum FP-91666 SS1]
MPSTISLQLAKTPSQALPSAKMMKLTRVIKSLRFFRRAALPSTKESQPPINIIIPVSDKPTMNLIPDILLCEKGGKQSKSILKSSPVDIGRLAIIPALVHAESMDTLNTMSSTNTDLSKLESSPSYSTISTTSSADDLSSSSTIEELDAIDPRPVNPERAWSLESLRSCIRKPRPPIRRIVAKKASKCVRFGAVVEYDSPIECAESTNNFEARQLILPAIPDRLQSRTHALHLSLIIVATMIRFLIYKVFEPCGELKGYSMEVHQPIPGFYDAEEWDS